MLLRRRRRRLDPRAGAASRLGRVPLVLTVHDRSFEDRPSDFTAYERLWHRLARPGALAAAPPP